MRFRKRSPKRAIDCRMRGTSAMSIPVPTIIFLNTSQQVFDALQQAVSAVNQFAVYHASFCGQAMWFDGTGPVDVQNFMSARHQPVRNQHAVAAEVYPLGTHVGGAGALG